MGKVSAFSIAGLDLWFNSSDHLPPHFHARKSDCWEIRIYFLLSREGYLDYKVKWCRKRIQGPELDAILHQVLKVRGELLKEWEQKVTPR